MNWITEPGMIAEITEGQPIEFPFLTTSPNATFTTSDVTILESAGFLLSGNGLFQGITHDVDIHNPHYLLKSSLPLSEQVKFLSNVRGFLDLSFDVTADDGVDQITETFFIRMVDFDRYPYWVPDLRSIELPEVETGDNVNFDFITEFTDFLGMDGEQLTLGNELLTLGGFVPTVSDPDEDQLTFNLKDGVPTLLVGSLPTNLTLDPSGKIVGIVSSFPNTFGLSRTYQFIIRVSDGLFFVDKLFVMKVKRTINSIPVWDNTTSPPSNIRPLAELTIAQPVDFRVLATDNDFDELTYKLTGTFPIDGLIFDNGRIHGTVGLSNSIGNVTFTVGVTDKFTLVENPNESDYVYQNRTFEINLDPYNHQLVSIDPIILEWVTPEGSLGKLLESEPSFYSLQVNTNSMVRFEVVSGSLPTGLTLSETGLIMGRATTPGIFTFQVIVFLSNNPTVFLLRQFELEITATYDVPVAYIRSHLNYNIKSDILNEISNINVSLFRSIDANYNTSLNPYIMTVEAVSKGAFYYAIKNKLPNSNPATWNRKTISPQQNYHSKLTLITGQARNVPVVIDDVYYYDALVLDLYDPAATIGGFDSEGEYDPVLYPAYDAGKITNPEEILPSSVNNWRTDIAIENEILPRWMQGKYNLAIVLLFLEKNTGNDVEIQLRDKLSGRSIVIDNYIYNDTFRFKFPPGDIN